MKLRREASLGSSVLIALQIAIAGCAIVLLNRMTPAIGRIVDDNVYSEEAVEDMLAALAMPAPIDEGRFEVAFERARNNVTEPTEPALLELVHLHRAAAFGGDAAALGIVIDALRGLGDVNRQSMSRADAAARQLGLTGAWAAALLGALAAGLGVLVQRRLRLRIEVPIDEVRATLARVRQHDLQARCPPNFQAPAEVQEIASAVNALLDRHLALIAPSTTTTTGLDAADLRRALQLAMDVDPRPRLLVARDGTIVARNAASADIELGPWTWTTAPAGLDLQPIEHTALGWLTTAEARVA